MIFGPVWLISRVEHVLGFAESDLGLLEGQLIALDLKVGTKAFLLHIRATRPRPVQPIADRARRSRCTGG